MMEAIDSSAASIFTRTTRGNTPEDNIFHCQRRENLKSYIPLTGWTQQRKCNVSSCEVRTAFLYHRIRHYS
jgi:hypothetical protein